MSPLGGKRNPQRRLMGASINVSNAKKLKSPKKLRKNVFLPKVKGKFSFDLMLRSTKNWGQLWVPP